MEAFLLILLVVFAVIAFMFVRFSMFKSKLMNAFGRLGVPFQMADTIYTQHSKYINDLHHQGHSAEMIAQHIVEELNL